MSAAQDRILHAVKYNRYLNRQLRAHLLSSFEDWQRADLSISDCYAAGDWLAMQELQQAAEEIHILNDAFGSYSI